MAKEPQNKHDETLAVRYSTQEKIVAMLLHNEERLVEAAEFLKPQHFDYHPLIEFTEIILEHFKKYHRGISGEEFLEEVDALLNRIPNLPVDEFVDAAEKVLKMPEDDFRYVRDKLIWFLRYAKMKEALIKSADIVREDGDYEEIGRKVQRALAIGEQSESRLDVIMFAEEAVAAVEWLWSGRVPKNKLTLIVGDPGVGKSWFTVWMAAQVTQGRALPGSEGPAVCGKVLHLSAEDDLNDTILPRFLAAGGDPERALFVRGLKDERRMFDLDRDLAELEKCVAAEPDVKLILIDPVTAYIGRGVDTHKEKDVRGLLAPVAAFAQKHNLAVVGVVHLNKSTDLGAIYRVSGSMAFVAAARAVWLVAEDTEDSNHRRFEPIKITNATKHDKGMEFSIAEGTVIVAEPERRVGADELLAPKERKGYKQRAAEPFLEEMFKEKAEVPASEVTGQAAEEKISGSTLRLARLALRIETRKTETGWLWFKKTGSDFKPSEQDLKS